MQGIKSYKDYSPFGAIMPGRNYNAGDYRYSFNGKENDSEIKGEGNSVDFGARIYDSRLGRWMSKDPDESNSGSINPYGAFENNPVHFLDPNGETAVASLQGNTLTISMTIIIHDKMSKKEIKKLQREVMKYYRPREYLNDDKKINVKFNIKFEHAHERCSNDKFKGRNDAVVEELPNDRSFSNPEKDEIHIDKSADRDNTRTWAHEIGHLIGFSDQYLEYFVKVAGRADQSMTKPDEIAANENGEKSLFGKGNVLTQEDINALADFAIKKINKEGNNETILNYDEMKLFRPTNNDIEKIKKSIEDSYNGAADVEVRRPGHFKK